jgi:hypothetical protein
MGKEFATPRKTSIHVDKSARLITLLTAVEAGSISYPSTVYIFNVKNVRILTNRLVGGYRYSSAFTSPFFLVRILRKAVLPRKNAVETILLIEIPTFLSPL